MTAAPAIPVDVADVTPEWLSEVLGLDIVATEVLDQHSGTTGRVRLGITYGGGDDEAEIRRANEDAWLARYREELARGGVELDAATAWEQYRLYAVYSWNSAVSTAAMGSRWQPEARAHAAMLRTTAAIEDLDSLGLLEERLR